LRRAVIHLRNDLRLEKESSRETRFASQGLKKGLSLNPGKVTGRKRQSIKVSGYLLPRGSSQGKKKIKTNHCNSGLKNSTSLNSSERKTEEESWQKEGNKKRSQAGKNL